MPLLRDDERLLHRALELAGANAAFASPNPAVGCVLTRAGQVLGEGAHRYNLRDHAEIAALKQAAALGHDVRGATAYVTLEPCSHQGRTGPCADALIVAGITRCVVATVDPNPAVCGTGLRRLREEGIEVVLAEPSTAVAQAARRLNDAFACAIQHHRPLITIKAAISADGKLAPAPSARTAREPFWLTGDSAREDVQRLRHYSDAVLTGIGTVLADDPSLTDRTGLPRRRPLMRIVLDAQLRTPLDSKLVRTAQRDLLLVAAHDAPPSREIVLRNGGADVTRQPSHRGRFDLQHLFAVLYRAPLQSVLVEAGTSLNGSLLAANLVDRVVLYRAALKLGPDALPFAKGQPSAHDLRKRLTGITEQAFPHGGGQDLRIDGYLHDPWAGGQ